MSGPRESTTGNALNNNAPYLSADRSELAPLYNNPQEVKGLKSISTFFIVFTVFVTVVLAIQLHYGNHQIIPHGTVATDSYNCSKIGADAIRRGGNSVDAVIASTICMGVVQPHLTGLGGGGLMLIYDQRQRRLRDCLDFRVLKSVSSSIGVPGLLAGLFQAHYHHGVLSWKDVIMPSVDLARSGVTVTESLLSTKYLLQDNSTKLYSWLIPLQKGQIMVNYELADVLELIADFGPDAFYNGNLTDQLVTFGKFRRTDVSGYQAIRGLTSGLCYEHVHNGYKVVMSSHGTGGPLVDKIVNQLNLTGTSDVPLATVGKALLEGNSSEMSWPSHAGSVVVATDRNDLYVSVVSGLGSVLGSKVRLPAGFILNNGLEVGALTGDSRAVSLSVPIIAVETNHVCGGRLLSGAADARDAVQLLYRFLSSQGEVTVTNVETIVESPRARFSSSSNKKEVWIEKEPRKTSVYPPFPSEADLAQLKEDGFNVTFSYLPYPSLNVIEKINDLVVAHSDSRGDGSVITF